jgi:putative membrane protein
MASMFYMPRLFVYHCEHKENKGFVEVVEIQEHKLFKFIGIPAFVFTLATGIAMIVISPELFKSGGWLHAKLTLVFILSIYFVSLEHYRRKLKVDPSYKSGKFFRIYNEIPTLLMIGIVILVLVQPF